MSHVSTTDFAAVRVGLIFDNLIVADDGSIIEQWRAQCSDIQSRCVELELHFVHVGVVFMPQKQIDVAAYSVAFDACSTG